MTEPAAFVTRFREYCIIGFTIEINLINRQVASAVAGTGGFSYAGITQMQKASYINVNAIPTTQASMQAQYDYKDLNLGKGKQKIWIKVSKYWKSKGQKWLALDSAGAASAYETGNGGLDCFTTIMISSQNMNGIDFGTFVVRPYIKFRGVRV